MAEQAEVHSFIGGPRFHYIDLHLYKELVVDVEFELPSPVENHVATVSIQLELTCHEF